MRERERESDTVSYVHKKNLPITDETCNMQLNGHRLRLMYGRPLQMNTIRSDTSARDRKIEMGGRVLISCDLLNKRGVWSVFHTHTTANTKKQL